jgi:hypothetical protein
MHFWYFYSDIWLEIMKLLFYSMRILLNVIVSVSGTMYDHGSTFYVYSDVPEESVS